MATHFFRMPRNVRSLDPSLCGSSGASAFGGAGDGDMMDVCDGSPASGADG